VTVELSRRAQRETERIATWRVVLASLSRWRAAVLPILTIALCATSSAAPAAAPDSGATVASRGLGAINASATSVSARALADRIFARYGGLSSFSAKATVTVDNYSTRPTRAQIFFRRPRLTRWEMEGGATVISDGHVIKRVDGERTVTTSVPAGGSIHVAVLSFLVGPLTDAFALDVVPARTPGRQILIARPLKPMNGFDKATLVVERATGRVHQIVFRQGLRVVLSVALASEKLYAPLPSSPSPRKSPDSSATSANLPNRPPAPARDPPYWQSRVLRRKHGHDPDDAGQQLFDG
jgi:hypothetical protein